MKSWEFAGIYQQGNYVMVPSAGIIAGCHTVRNGGGYLERGLYLGGTGAGPSLVYG